MTQSARKIGAIVLMAGQSSRMECGNKLLMTVGESHHSVAYQTLQSITKAGYSPIVVVTGHDAQLIQETLQYLDVLWIYNPMYKEGMGASIAKAFQDIVMADWDAALIALGDMPFVSIETLQKLRQQSIDKPAEIVVPTFQARRGQPVIFPAQFFEALKQCRGDVGGKFILKTNPDRVRCVEVNDEGIHWDVDTIERFREYTARWNEGRCD